MNFLAPLQNLFKPEAPKTNASLSVAYPVARPVQSTQRPLARVVEPVTIEDRGNIARHVPGPRLEAWQEAKRIQRLRNVARLSSYGKAQIEHVQVSGLWAQIALRLYDNMSEESQYRFIAMPMSKLYEYVNLAWNKQIE